MFWQFKFTSAVTLLQAIILGSLAIYTLPLVEPAARATIWCLAGMGLLFCVVLAWWWSGRVLRRLRDLQTGLQAIVQERYGEKIQEQKNVDLEETNQVFNRMSRELQPSVMGRMAVATALPVGKRILLVEDSPTIQMIVAEQLTQAGLAVDVADNGLACLDALSRAVYDLILMDLSMPVMDGWTAIRQIRQLADPWNVIPIVILTANTFPGVREACMAIGAQDYLTKPVQPDLLLETVHGFLARSETVVTQVNPVTLPNSESDSGSVLTAVPLLDASVLEQMARDTPPELVPRMVNIFIQEAEKRRERILLDVSSGDAHAVHLEVHALKSSAGTFGARALYNAALEADLAGKNGDDKTLLQLGQELPALIQRTNQAFRAYFL
ncbi:MAG: response regulator [Magnetococcus sp. DMHC-1]|nr:response regulator [Magnetococcales bacterium]